MTNISCNATTCGYNEGKKCAKKYVFIEGLFAKSKIGTFCQSFKNPHGSDILSAEMAKEMYLNPEAVKVECSANYCRYNDNNYCIAKDIKIGCENARYRSETQCDSFKTK